MPADESRLEALTFVLAILMVLALGYSIAEILSPFVITGALIFLLYPFRHHKFAGRLLWLAVILFVLWFVHSIIGLLAPFIVAFIAAYMLNPFVVRLEKRSLPRWASSLIAVLLLIGVVVAVILFLVPPAVRQFEGILEGISLIAGEVSDFFRSGELFAILARLGIPVEDAQDFVSRELSPRLSGLLQALFEGMFGFVSGFSSIVLHIINAVIIPFVIFYLLKDLPFISEKVLTLLPAGRREGMVGTLRKVDNIIGRYLRGAVIVAIIQGCISGVVLWLLGVNYALVLGIMTGILNFIPYIGLLTSLAVSSLVAAFSGGPVLGKIIGVVILYLSQKLLEASVLGPKIIGTQVGLHPVLLILCLLIFGYFLGFVGMLIAVPATALIMAGTSEWLAARDAATSRPANEAS